jgi:hypothetical protein
VALVLSGLLCTLLHAQLSDEEKRAEFLKARARTEAAAAKESPTPSSSHHKHKAAHHKSKSATPAPRTRKKTRAKSKKSKESEKAAPAPEKTRHRHATRKSAGKKTHSREAKAKERKQTRTSTAKKTRRKAEAPTPAETPVVRRAVPTERIVPIATPSHHPAPRSAVARSGEEPEQLTIEKYGYRKPRGFWERLFGIGGGSSGGYRYLTRSVRAEIDRAPVRRGRWQYIVVHNSGTRQGNARVFDYYHRHVRHMPNGLAYHFVIGNGTSTGNGQIEVGDRWRRQINGGHVHSDYLNNIALGICLVGDFNRDLPHRAQLESCEELIRYLRQRCGKVGNHYPIVLPHKEINPPRWSTDCPGDRFPYAWFRRFQE